MIEVVVTGSLYTNSYIISNNDNECVLVDPGLSYEKAANLIKEKYKVKAILITHGHVDHIDGIKYFDVPVYIHEADEAFLYDSSLSLYIMMGMRTPFKKGSLNVNTVKDGDVISLIGYDFKVMHTPGHTRGSVCYSYKNKVLSGDTLFNNSCGRTDFPTGSGVDMSKSLKRIIDEYPSNYDVYPGHDSKTTIKKEQNNPYIR
ncbi:MAG: MBL fold metallo-hydrolase [Acholeplasmatales bacterium]|nr:MBL fold metallo-hydrolase [Acholeplasmatales bacterium]